MCKRNWREYNRSLVQRGSLTFIIDPKILKTQEIHKIKKRKGRPAGRPLEFSDSLILMCLMIKIHFKMPYRMLEGFARFFLEKLQKIKIPTYSLVCKRAKALAFKLPALSSRRPSTVIIDSTGIKVYGEGEWKVKIHGKERPRKWIKLHVIIDAKTQEIIGEISTESSVDDGKAFFDITSQVSFHKKTLIGDGAYDDKNIRNYIRRQKGKTLVPPPKNAVCRGQDKERDESVLNIRLLGGDKTAKSIWGKISGYSQRSLVETTFSRYKKMFGDRAFSKSWERLVLENRLKCVLLNKMVCAAA